MTLSQENKEVFKENIIAFLSQKKNKGTYGLERESRKQIACRLGEIEKKDLTLKLHFASDGLNLQNKLQLETDLIPLLKKNSPVIFEVPEFEIFDIDYPWQFVIAEEIFKNMIK